MAEIKNITFEHTELAEMLVKHQNISEGHWGIYFEFGLMGGNVPLPPDGKILSPAAIVIANKIGIQRFDEPSNLTVDAARVNPAKKAAK